MASEFTMLSHYQNYIDKVKFLNFMNMPSVIKTPKICLHSVISHQRGTKVLEMLPTSSTMINSW